MFKSPRFWKTHSFVSYILRPLSWLYLKLARFKERSITPQKLSVPVICVGNLVLGGAGKTPTVISLVKLLKSMGHTPHILSRGYGAVIKDLKQVNPEDHHYLQVGDEPLILSQFAPTWVSPNRVKAGKAAIKQGATVLIMDDGFQNTSLVKDLNVLVVDSNQGFGNGEVFPAGPLREPIDSGLKRADAIFCIGDPKRIKLKQAHKAHFVVKTFPTEPNERVIAFSGLGYPEKFRQTLKEAGYKIVEFVTFADHYPYTVIDMDRLVRAAEVKKASLITTSKDFVRIPPNFKNNVQVLKVNLAFDEPDVVLEMLEKTMSSFSPHLL